MGSKVVLSPIWMKLITGVNTEEVTNKPCELKWKKNG